MTRKVKTYWKASEHDPALIRLHATGKSDKQIAAETGHAEETIRHYRKALGLKSNKGEPSLPKLVVERPLTTKTAKEPGWDFSRDNLDLPGGRFGK